MLLEEITDVKPLSAYTMGELRTGYAEIVRQDLKKDPDSARKNLMLLLITNEISRRTYQKKKEQEASVI